MFLEPIEKRKEIFQEWSDKLSNIIPYVEERLFILAEIIYDMIHIPEKDSNPSIEKQYNAFQEELDKLILTDHRARYYYDEGIVTKQDRENLQELVDKATPKKIKDYNGVPICPVCNSVNYIHNEGGVESKNKFCSNCGQALDWSEK